MKTIETCLGHITSSCPNCKPDDKNKQCPNYNPTIMRTFEIIEQPTSYSLS